VRGGFCAVKEDVVSVVETLRSEDLRMAEALAGQVHHELDAAFASLVTAERLTERLGELVGDAEDHPSARREELQGALERLNRIDVDVWSIEHASEAAQTIRDLLQIARHQGREDA
jgi:hypothetical protein